MKKVVTGLLITAIALAVVIVLYIFRQETAYIGKYTVLYYKNQCDLPPKTFPQDLLSLMNLPCVIRITWQEEIAAKTFQEYCYLPGKGIEKSRILQKK
jgi:hypothetical protein